MAMRALIAFERENLARLTGLGVDVTLIQPTQTGLTKSILDATAAVRYFFQEKGIHDYEIQGLGAKENGTRVPAVLVSPERELSSRASLYRPQTKLGDPRLWFSGLNEFAKPNDILAIAVHDGVLMVINLTATAIGRALDEAPESAFSQRLAAISREAGSIASELLELLRRLASQGPTKSVMPGKHDTAIGRTLEKSLGIPINSRRAPDYKGIELKAQRRARSGRRTRSSLFAQVPDWSISKCKSSKEILASFGWADGGGRRLYCTVSASKPNQQGLFLELDPDHEFLNECSTLADIGAFATWRMKKLRAELAAKHNETFWVSASVEILDEFEHFQFERIMHTRAPLLSQFDLLIEQGDLTLDHLIKSTSSGGVKEKGPLFKLKPTSHELLFPAAVHYDLI